MQDAIAAAVVALAVALLTAKGWRAIQRRCRPQDKNGCDKCGKCG